MRRWFKRLLQTRELDRKFWAEAAEIRRRIAKLEEMKAKADRKRGK